jgi:hypothetical protein
LNQNPVSIDGMSTKENIEPTKISAFEHLVVEQINSLTRGRGGIEPFRSCLETITSAGVNGIKLTKLSRLCSLEDTIAISIAHCSVKNVLIYAKSSLGKIAPEIVNSLFSFGPKMLKCFETIMNFSEYQKLAVAEQIVVVDNVYVALYYKRNDLHGRCPWTNVDGSINEYFYNCVLNHGVCLLHSASAPN